jgi:hypothetical protein
VSPAGTLLQPKPRFPWGITVLGYLACVGAGLSFATLLLMLRSLNEMQAKVSPFNQPLELFVLGFVLSNLVLLLSGMGLLRREKGGWIFTTLYYWLELARSIHTVWYLAAQAGTPGTALATDLTQSYVMDSLRFGAQALVITLILLYLYRQKIRAALGVPGPGQRYLLWQFGLGLVYFAARFIWLKG